jgi:MFS family permease
VPSVLTSGLLRRIVAGYTVNRLGTWFGFIALSVAVFDHTHSALAVGGLLLASQVLPAFVVPMMVARVEVSTRRGALSALYLFEALTSGLLVLLLIWHFMLPAVLLLVALDGTAALAASALLRAAAARAAREWARDELHPAPGDESVEVEAERRANAALNIGFALTFVLGPALAGLIVPTLGVSAALLLDMASFAICGAMLLDLRPQLEDGDESSVRERLRAAWAHIREAGTLRRLLLIEAIALAFFEFSPPIEVAYAKVSLHAGDSGYGLLLGTWGLGVAIGSIVFARSIQRSLGILLSASTLAVGVAYLGWAVAPTLAIACGAGLIGGVGNGVQWAALISAVQRITPQALHGQMMGAVESIGAISPGVGFALGSAIVAVSSPRTAFVVAGIGASLSTVAFMRLRLGARATAATAPGEGETVPA